MKITFLIFLVLSVLCQQENTIISQKSVLDDIVSQFINCGEGENQVMLILTEKGTVYKSKDKGMRWNKMSSQFFTLGYEELEFQHEQVGAVSQILISPADKNYVIFQGSHHINWKSTNCGQDIVAMNQGRPVHEFQFHPTEKNKLLAAAWNNCDDFDENQTCEIYKEIFVSFDLGSNWRHIGSYVQQFGWGFQTKDYEEYINKDRIYLAHQPQGKGNQQVGEWSNNVHLYYSDDYFKTQKLLVQQGNHFQIQDDFFFVVKALNNKEVSLYVSGLKKHNFQEVTLPYKKFKDHGYDILDSSEGQLFVFIDHLGQGSKFGNIYISDSTGTRLSISLLHNAVDEQGNNDFRKIDSLEGVYIANVYDQQKIVKIEKSQIDFDKKPSQQDHLDNYKQTKITFDKGGVWKGIKAPLFDSLGQKYECIKNCELHLHMATHAYRFGPVYCSKNALGLIIATGNVGKYLSTKRDKANTFLSLDGGMSWKEIRKGSHIYEVSDHGGLIVMAKDQEETNEIFYSWDEGSSWETYKFTDKPVEIYNIENDENSLSLNFIVYGTDQDGRGFTLGVDFTQLHQRACQGLSYPDSSDSDYIFWQPGHNQKTCVLGRQITYVKRKPDSKCFNGEKFERPTNVKHCSCTEEDYECDLGYIRGIDGPCVPIQNKKEIHEAPEQCDGYYEISTGYRRIAGNSCYGGINHSPIVIPCPNNYTQRYYKYLLYLFFILVLIQIIKYTDFKRFSNLFNSSNGIPQYDQNIKLNDKDQEEDDFDPRV